MARMKKKKLGLLTNPSYSIRVFGNGKSIWCAKASRRLRVTGAFGLLGASPIQSNSYKGYYKGTALVSHTACVCPCSFGVA